MNIEQQPLENHQVKLIVQIEPSKLEDAKHRAARHISQHKKIPGFRPGKAPYPIIVRTFGDEAILEEAIDILVKDVYPKVIEESKVQPYGPGSLESMPSLDPLTFEFVVPLEPEVILGKYQNIRIPYKLKNVTKKDINKVLDDLRDKQAVLEPSEQPAQEGDQVYIKLSIKRINPAEGEMPTLVNDRRMPVIIAASDDKNESAWPYPGFARELLGMKQGDEKNIRYTYPDNSDYKELRGKETELQIVVEEIKKRILPELTDEFAQTIGEQYADLNSLTNDIRKSLEQQNKEAYNEQYNEKIMGTILKETVIKYPPQMRDREIDLFTQQFVNRLEQQKLDLDTYLKIRKMDETALRAEIAPQAEERLRRTLVLLEIAKAENIHVENSELESETMRTLDEIGRIMPPDEAKKTLTNEFVRGMVGNIGADLLVKHTWDHLQSVARGEKETMQSTEGTDQPEQAINNIEPVETTKKRRTTRKVEKNEP